MAIILEFSRRAGEKRPTVTGEASQSGSVVLFTGVRVERQPESEAPVEGPTPRRKGAQARRQRKI